MARLKLEKEVYELNESIMIATVNGIVNGTDRFKNDKRSAKDELAVYSGFDWLRSNMVDTGIENTLKAYGLDSVVTTEKDQVGSHGYLKFSVKSSHSLIIVKRVTKNVSKNVINRTSADYVEIFKRINKNNFIQEESVLLPIDVQSGLDLSHGDENNPLEKEPVDKYNRFYVLTYTVDSKNVVTSVKMWMPDPYNNNVVGIKDYSYMLGDIKAGLNQNDTQNADANNIGKPEIMRSPFSAVESRDKDDSDKKKDS